MVIKIVAANKHIISLLFSCIRFIYTTVNKRSQLLCYKTLTSLTLLFVMASCIYATEENTKIPFYYLKDINVKMELSSSVMRVCRVLSREVVYYEKYKVKECYSLTKKLSSLLKQVLKENPKKKEITLMFFDAVGSRKTPKVNTVDGIFEVQAIIFMGKDKSVHLELVDEKKNYYFFMVNPRRIYLTEDEEH